MASLAPGNGWVPPRAYGSRETYYGKAVRRQPIRASSNEHEVRHVGIPVMSPIAVGSGRGRISKILDALVVEPLKAGHTATWLLAWGVFAAVLPLIIWLDFMTAIAGGAVALGVP